MSRIQVFKITGVCTFEGDYDDSPCTCFPNISMTCLEEMCEYFAMYEGEIDETDLD